jgi:endonuclease/exonuclease/phosphatase family metal-dependent hydrolase
MFALILLAGCRQPDLGWPMPDYKPADNEFSVMTYNVMRYGREDRDGDGQDNDPKPAGERRLVIEIIQQANPDVLVLQEMGGPEVFKEFTYSLKQAGLVYEHVEYLRRGRHENNIVLLSRLPVIARQSHLDDLYSIGPAKVPVARGFIDVDIQVNPQYRFRLMGAHLKSKVYNRLGQTEMRRNEARLLNKHVRAALKEHPERNLLVVGDLNDNINSAAMREVMGKRKRILFDLCPADFLGTIWTYFDDESDTYTRIDYMLASRGMSPEIVKSKSHAVCHQNLLKASDHRPLVGVFRASDIKEVGVSP